MQLGVAQLVPAGSGMQAPPLHPAVQLAVLGVHAASVPVALQVPKPLRSQRWQTGHDALPQQTPLTQFPEPQSVPAPHASPLGLTTHVPFVQIFPVPQLVLLGTLPVDTQTEVPDAQEVNPV